ncbi:MAG: peptidylprolyl isomerase [Planctomycetota bacterium]
MALTRTTFPIAILLCAAPMLLGGCGVIQWIESLGDEDDSVPVTRPTAVDANAAEALANVSDGAEANEDPTGGGTAIDAPVDTKTTPADPVDANGPDGGDPNAAQADPNARGVQVVSGGSLRINDEFIRPEEIVRYASPRLSALPKGLSPADFRRRAAQILGDTIQQRIHMTLVLGQAREKLTEQQDGWVKAKVQDYKRSLVAQAGSVEKLRDDLEKRHTTLKQVLDARRDQLQYQIFLQARFESAIVITRRKLLQYYRANQDEFASPKRVQFRLITIPRGDDDQSKADAMKTARKAMDRIRNGETFAEVAKDISKGPRRGKGGLWPKMGQGEFAVKPVDKALFEMKEDEVSEIIETDSALFIAKAVEVDEARVAPFEEAQKGIAEKLRSKQEKALHEEYFSHLYENANVQRSEDFLTKVLQLAEERFHRH